MINIQLVDDDPSILSALKRIVRDEGWKVDTYTDPQDALAALSQKAYAVIVSDLHMPELDGITFLQFSKQIQPDAMRLLLSGYGDRDSLTKAINNASIYRFVSKPWETYELLSTLRSAVELYQLQNERRQLLDELQQQKNIISRHKNEWQRLQIKHPTLLEVIRDEDGNILLGEE
jgi:two-component system probable response regulator PhcQ